MNMHSVGKSPKTPQGGKSASAPGIFERVMESLLRGIQGVVVYIDDILVTGKTKADHLAALDEVLMRLENAGLHLKRKKCSFMQPSVTYIDAKGLHILPDSQRSP